MYRSRELEAESDVSDERLRTNPGVDPTAAIIVELIAARLGLQRYPRDPRTRCPPALGRCRKVGRGNAEVLDQAPRERVHGRRQASGDAGCLIEFGAGPGIFEPRPVQRCVTVQPLPDRKGQHRDGSGEEFAGIHG